MTQKRFNNLKVGQRIRLTLHKGSDIYTITTVFSRGHYKLSDGGEAVNALFWSLVPSPRKPRKKKGNKI